MKEEKMYFLQTGFKGFPMGTPLVEVEPPSEVLVARAMVGKDVLPTKCYQLFGNTGEVLIIPSFEGYVSEQHPLSKEVVGPFVAGSIRMTSDRLRKGVKALVAMRRDYPFMELCICLNSDETAPDVKELIQLVMECAETGDVREFPYTVIIDQSVYDLAPSVVGKRWE